MRTTSSAMSPCALPRRWSHLPAGVTMPVIDGGETRAALGALAHGWRQRFALPLVAVTGSNGKTTVKEMIASIFAAAVGADARLATAGNLNNDVGLPLTLLRLSAAHRLAVIEIGMNHPGETEVLRASRRRRSRSSTTRSASTRSSWRRSKPSRSNTRP